jgi:hypothetical protein
LTFGQNLHWPVYLSTASDHSFSEWILLNEDEESIGLLKRQWPNTDNWGEWSYEMEELNGRIKQKWADDPNIWELTSGQELYTARTTYPGVYSSWEIEGTGKKKATFFTPYPNTPIKWELKKSKLGSFQMEIRSEGDFRDWFVWESLSEGESPNFHMFLIFLAVYHSCPLY